MQVVQIVLPSSTKWVYLHTIKSFEFQSFCFEFWFSCRPGRTVCKSYQTCFPVACSRLLDSRAQRSDGEERVKSHAGKQGGKTRLPPFFFFPRQFFFRALLSERLKQASFPVAYDQNPGHFVLYCTVLRVVWVLTAALCFYRLLTIFPPFLPFSSCTCNHFHLITYCISDICVSFGRLKKLYHGFISFVSSNVKSCLSLGLLWKNKKTYPKELWGLLWHI